MINTIRFCLVLHNHQPIGNFDEVFEQAYQDSYLPFIDTFEPYRDLQLSLHTSGPLMEWLDLHHPDYLDRLRQLVADGRVEILGGAFYEPILTMIPRQDRVGQIQAFSRWLERRLGGSVSGMWVPERVWEQSLTSDLVQAGIDYTLLDDFHFRNAGLTDDQLHGYYLTEDEGRLLRVFPGSEYLRYSIPFGSPEQTINYLRQIAERTSNAVVVFGDDGEKFGTWPETKQHVYGEGWLRSFFDAVQSEREWLHTTTLREAAESASPWGTVYLPDASYREMTEWALPTDQQIEYDAIGHDMADDPRWPRIRQFVRGGFWRNFKTKYPEANEMYSRMMMVSRRLQETEQAGFVGDLVDQARRALYRSQCNCSYWHGAFGGIYLPHLRNAVYGQLIAADNALEQINKDRDAWVEATVDDYNLDARPEVRLASDQLVCLLAPAAGGQIYELDVRAICHNLQATLARRPEPYHRKVLAGNQNGNSEVASIHDRVVCKQEGLDQRLQYDRHLRKSLIDHFYELDVPPSDVRDANARELGDFVNQPYATRVRRNPDRVQIQLTREGAVDGRPVKITKGVTAESSVPALEIAYLLEGLSPEQCLHFGVEFNFAGMPSRADDRFFYNQQSERLGQLQTELDLTDCRDLCLVDHWLGLDVRLSTNQPTGWWTFPIETVSQSEGGFELVHQSIVVHPHWVVKGDADGRWSVTLMVQLDTSLAAQKIESPIGAIVT